MQLKADHCCIACGRFPFRLGWCFACHLGWCKGQFGLFFLERDDFTSALTPALLFYCALFLLMSVRDGQSELRCRDRSIFFSAVVQLLYLCLKKHLKFFPRVNKKSRHRFYFFALCQCRKKRTRDGRERRVRSMSCPHLTLTLPPLFSHTFFLSSPFNLIFFLILLVPPQQKRRKVLNKAKPRKHMRIRAILLFVEFGSKVRGG